MSIGSLKDVSFEDSELDIARAKWSNVGEWKMMLSTSGFFSEYFEFDLKIVSPEETYDSINGKSTFCVGVSNRYVVGVDEESKKFTVNYFGEGEIWTNYFGRLNMVYQFPEVPKFSSGDTISFSVCRRKRKFLMRKNDGKFFQVKIGEETYIPKELCIKVYGRSGFDVEVVRVKSSKESMLSIICGDDLSSLERLDFVHEHFSNFSIPLQDATIKVPKPLLLFSSAQLDNPSNNTNEFRKLSNRSLDIDDKKIMSFLLGSNEYIDFKKLSDYYFFFRELGLRYPLWVILRNITRMDSFSECYFLFKSFCLSHENETIRSWFSTNGLIQVKQFGITSFDTSFALSLFNRLKEMENEFVMNLHLDVYVGYVFYHVQNNYRHDQMIDVICHPDFSEVHDNLEEFSPLSLLRTLYQQIVSRKSSSSSSLISFSDMVIKPDIRLVSTDGIEFWSHKVVLILRYSFFHLMFQFQGSEIEEYNKTGKIQLQDTLSSDVVQSLICFAYNNHLGTMIIKTNNENESENENTIDLSCVETLIKLIIHADKFDENRLFQASIQKLKEIAKNLSSSSSSSTTDENSNTTTTTTTMKLLSSSTSPSRMEDEDEDEEEEEKNNNETDNKKKKIKSNDEKKSVLQQILLRVGYLLYDNDGVCEHVIPLLVQISQLSNEFIYETLSKFITKSYYIMKEKECKKSEEEKEEEEDNDDDDIIMSRKDLEILELKKKNQILERKIEVLLEKTEFQDNDEGVLGGGKIRKRDSDEKDIEKEVPKKKRKFQDDV